MKTRKIIILFAFNIVLFCLWKGRVFSSPTLERVVAYLSHISFTLAIIGAFAYSVKAILKRSDNMFFRIGGIAGVFLVCVWFGLMWALASNFVGQ